MSDDTNRADAIQRMMHHLDGFARGLGIGEATMRRVVEQVAADMPDQDGEDLLIEARTRMILATV